MLHFLEKGTPVLIGLESGFEIEAKFVSTSGETRFYIISDEILDDIENLTGRHVSVTVFHMDNYYKAECEILGEGMRKGIHETVKLELVSAFEKKARRNSARVDMEINAAICSYNEKLKFSRNYTFAYEALSEDISRDGACLNSRYDLDAPQGTMFMVEFKLSDFLFIIPAKLMRRQQTGISSYRYGFLFDFSDVPELQDKLIVEIFKVKLNV